MTDLFQMTITFPGETMNDFGEAVAKIGVQFPHLVLTDAHLLATLCKAEVIDLPKVELVLTRLIQNAQAAAKIGNAVATTIGMCQPVRIDGGSLQ